MDDNKKGNIEIPDHVLERLARPLLRIVPEYFKRPGVQEEYEKWLAEREAKQNRDNNEV